MKVGSFSVFRVPLGESEAGRVKNGTRKTDKLAPGSLHLGDETANEREWTRIGIQNRSSGGLSVAGTAILLVFRAALSPQIGVHSCSFAVDHSRLMRAKSPVLPNVGTLRETCGGNFGLRVGGEGVEPAPRFLRSGCSSVVERNLAKVDVDSSNLFTRSILLCKMGKSGAARQRMRTQFEPEPAERAETA